VLPVGYFHVLFTVPAKVGVIAFHSEAAVYDLLFRAASETMLTIAADPHDTTSRENWLVTPHGRIQPQVSAATLRPAADCCMRQGPGLMLGRCLYRDIPWKGQKLNSPYLRRPKLFRICRSASGCGSAQGRHRDGRAAKRGGSGRHTVIDRRSRR
jgi:hypothetical protein